MPAAQYDVVVLGAGAAGLACAIQAGYRGRRVLVLDNGKKIGRKILISGGGRCNFTNRSVEPKHFLSENPHFVKSALARYGAQAFIEWVERHGIEYEERDLGKLFCLGSAKEIVAMLETEADWAGVSFRLETTVVSVEKTPSGFSVETDQGSVSAKSLVVATGGLSIPKMGASPLGYRIAEHFGLKVVLPHAGLVPFTWQQPDKERYQTLAGVSHLAGVWVEGSPRFTENILFTHRGLSGPAMLQASSFWCSGKSLNIDFSPNLSLLDGLISAQKVSPDQSLNRVLSQWMPKRLLKALPIDWTLEVPVRNLTPSEISQIAQALHYFQLKPNGTEGYRTAEVTCGGVDTNELSSKTMESRSVKGLYFIGEVVDVTGWLGGYNFQWAWSSGYVCGLEA